MAPSSSSVPATATAASVAASAAAAAAPRKWRRVHGLQTPLHPQQGVAWALLAAFACLMHLAVVPSLASKAARTALHGAYAGVYLAHLVAHFMATLVDPADPNLRAKGREAARRPVPKFDRSRFVRSSPTYTCRVKIHVQ